MADKLLRVPIGSTFGEDIKDVEKHYFKLLEDEPERTWAIVPATHIDHVNRTTREGYHVVEILID